MKRVLISIIAALFCLPSMAQTKKADRLFHNWDYFRAAKHYEKEADKNPSADVYFKLGECYRIMKQYKNKELSAFDKVNAAGVYSKPEFYLKYGLVLRRNGRYRHSKVAFQKFHELMPEDSTGAFFSDAIDIVLNDQRWDETICIINVAELNTEDADFCPVFYNQGLMFVSARKSSFHEKIHGWTGANYLDLYYAKKGDNNLAFTSVSPFSNKNRAHNDGPVCFSANYDTIYITRAQKTRRYKIKNKFWIDQNKIFSSTKKDGQWLASEPFTHNSDDFSVAIPHLSPDGSRLYFAADMPGGYGETDLYYCKREGDGWGKPINMGSNINTFNSESFPFVDRSGNFYFSSNGYQGFGGLDICVARNINGTLQKAIPMKYPFNSYSDDFGIIFIEDGKTGYFSSNRELGGFGDDDIFYFDLTKDDLPDNFETSAYTVGYRPKLNERDVRFLVNAPKNAPVERRVREIFPLRNYVFFDKESTDIPDRYVLLSPDQVSEFKEDKLEAFPSVYSPNRSKRQMTAYYNVLNIIGNRLAKNPEAEIILVGSSEKSPEDGEAMAESIKNYLTEIFQINKRRISIEGRNKPKIPSKQLGGMLELELLREGDRRVSIESRSPVMLMEYHTGPETLLKPIDHIDLKETPLKSYVSLNAIGSDKFFSSWSIEIMDIQGTSLFLGPYTREKVSIPGKVILGNKSEGDFKVTMTGKAFNGNTVIKDTTIHVGLWRKSASEEGIRYSVVFEFNRSKLIPIYEKYLTEVVAPKIPQNGTLIIHGHTDVIGDKKNNLELSLARANKVGDIFKYALANAKRTDVKMEIYGFGEDQDLSPFDNNLPEERFHNRTVIVNIISNKE